MTIGRVITSSVIYVHLAVRGCKDRVYFRYGSLKRNEHTVILFILPKCMIMLNCFAVLDVTMT